MDHQIPASFDATQDMYEIGLMAAASPEFAEAFARAMLGADPQPEAQTCDPPVDDAQRR